MIDSENPVWIGVAPGTIQTQRATVLRGRILVDVKILGHPEFGSTASRAQTGAFDRLVNWGGKLMPIFEAAG